MRSAGRITCLVLCLALSSFILTALADESGHDASPVEVQSLAPEKACAIDKQMVHEKVDKPYFDPDLESIMAVKDRSEYEFISRLTPAEQRALYRIIKNRVDDEAGIVVSVMALVSTFVPAFISAQFVDKMEPATVARISDKVSVGKAIAIGKRVDSEFLAEVAIYQDPKRVTAVVEGFPDKKLIEVNQVLVQKGEYRVIAKFSDDLSVEKLATVAEKIDDPVTLIEISRYMENKEKAAETAVMLSDDYLLRFMELLSTDADFELAAATGRELTVERQIKLLNRLAPEKAARLAAHYSPETIARIMGSTMGETIDGVSDQQLIDITRILVENGNYPVVARFSDVLSPEKMKDVAERINDPSALIEIARHMEDRGKIVEAAAALPDNYLLNFMRLLSSCDDYALAAAVGSELDLERQISMLKRLAPETAARLTAHYPPETIALIIEKSDDNILLDIANRLSPEIMGHVSSAVQPKDINRIIELVSRHQLLAALPHIDLTRIQDAWPELSSETRRILKDMGEDSPSLANAISRIE